MEVHDLFKILKQINDNAYKIEFYEDYTITATFNIADLSPHHED